MKWIARFALGAVAAAAAVTLFLLMFIGPRMRTQPHIRAFQARMLLPPVGTVPVEERPALPTEQEAEVLGNPLADTPENRARGKVYYGYYCAFCHGPEGDGKVPVGESYVPAPASLREARLAAYSDGKYLRSMLTGTGHAPVLERVVPPQHRWYVELYARGFASSPASP